MTKKLYFSQLKIGDLFYFNSNNIFYRKPLLILKKKNSFTGIEITVICNNKIEKLHYYKETLLKDYKAILINE